jgi:hypothetical protein
MTINRGIDDDEDSEEDFKQDEPIGKEKVTLFGLLFSYISYFWEMEAFPMPTDFFPQFRIIIS